MNAAGKATKIAEINASAETNSKLIVQRTDTGCA